ncbi:MAG: 4,5-dihydroxyphthalate decarboxylase [Ramlibacter sp.]|nr:4,5-dihydroxyphthalate decarboxylase [Ramlibacter sp.]MDB5914042.1 4,5-dihydroxyphthalate decarboxylase [Ramlibacter sp.]
MSKLTLSIGINDYDHVRDLLSGRVQAEGIDLLPSVLPVEEIFYRFIKFREWDVAEMSFAKYISLTSQGGDGLTAIPVFPSRVFRQSSFYVRAGSELKSAAQLAGCRIGVPEWAQTASIYSRGYLTGSVGIPLTAIDWVQAGVNEAGRAEKVEIKLPDQVRLTRRPDSNLNTLLLGNEIDVVLSARPPRGFAEGSIVRLFDDSAAVERAWYQETGIFPIMHVIAIRKEQLDRHPWIATNLLKAFTQAKDRSVERALDITCSHFPLPWIPEAAKSAQATMGNDFWPYGIEPNRPTLQAFADFAFEQGVCHRRVALEELFPVQVQSSVKV